MITIGIIFGVAFIVVLWIIQFKNRKAAGDFNLQYSLQVTWENIKKQVMDYKNFFAKIFGK